MQYAFISRVNCIKKCVGFGPITFLFHFGLQVVTETFFKQPFSVNKVLGIFKRRKLIFFDFTNISKCIYTIAIEYKFQTF